MNISFSIFFCTNNRNRTYDLPDVSRALLPTELCLHFNWLAVRERITDSRFKRWLPNPHLPPVDTVRLELTTSDVSGRCATVAPCVNNKAGILFFKWSVILSRLSRPFTCIPCTCGPAWIRTKNLPINSRGIYQLMLQVQITGAVLPLDDTPVPHRPNGIRTHICSYRSLYGIWTRDLRSDSAA